MDSPASSSLRRRGTKERGRDGTMVESSGLKPLPLAFARRIGSSSLFPRASSPVRVQARTGSALMPLCQPRQQEVAEYRHPLRIAQFLGIDEEHVHLRPFQL